MIRAAISKNSRYKHRFIVEIKMRFRSNFCYVLGTEITAHLQMVKWVLCVSVCVYVCIKPIRFLIVFTFNGRCEMWNIEISHSVCLFGVLPPRTRHHTTCHIVLLF